MNFIKKLFITIQMLIENLIVFYALGVNRTLDLLFTRQTPYHLATKAYIVCSLYIDL